MGDDIATSNDVIKMTGEGELNDKEDGLRKREKKIENDKKELAKKKY